MRAASIVGLTVGMLGATAVCAQDYPTKMIRMIVPGLPGGSADILARMIGTKLHERTGQPVVVDNRSGAGQMIGAEALAKSPPDGHALLFATITYTTSVATRATLPFDPLNDVTGVTMVGRGPLLLVVHPSLPVKSVKDFISLAKARPGAINYGSSGTGTIVHLVAESFASRAGIDIVHVPFKSIAPAVTAAVGGHIPVMFASTPAAGHHVKANRLRALAVTTSERSGFMPDLPTVAEAGVPRFEASTWWGLFVQGKTPRELVGRLNGEIRKVLVADDIKARVTAEGAQVVLGLTPDEFNTLVKSEIERWRQIVKERNITVDS
jgi:tripartite-type tricarboxylate transporter receptor subunit TctC